MGVDHLLDGAFGVIDASVGPTAAARALAGSAEHRARHIEDHQHVGLKRLLRLRLRT
jgi:hypothetical protein